MLRKSLKLCPQPVDQDERLLQEEESQTYVRGRISFIIRNPGQQILCGSFQPIESGEWCATAYRTPLEKLVNAISNHDYATVREMLSVNENPVDVNGLTLDGWSPLQIAIKDGADHVLPDLIRAGARWPKFEDTCGLPAYQEHSPMRLRSWPLSCQVERLAYLFHQLFVQVEATGAKFE